MNDRKTEFPLGEIFCESFIIGVLRISERRDLNSWSCRDMPKFGRGVVVREKHFIMAKEIYERYPFPP
jgi:hypothetical protein